MLMTIALVFLIAWLLGIFGVYTLGAALQVFLIVAIALVVAGLLNRRRTVV